MYCHTFPSIHALFIFSLRQGSIAADFIVVVEELNPTEIAEVNEKLPLAMSSIAPVIGEVRATYTSKFNKKYTVMMVVFLISDLP